MRSGRRIAETIAVCNTKEIMWIIENKTKSVNITQNIYVKKTVST